ncbi:MAG: type I restriction enzyme HsdR N-terminal domain-containing protein [Cyanobacteria bacterium J06641_5]
MAATTAIEQLTLAELEEKFGLTFVSDPTFFSEWQGSLPELASGDVSRLQRVRAEYENLERRVLSEKTVELVILAPLLDLAGFFLPPFYIETEKPVEIAAMDGEELLKGRLDMLILRDRLWVLAIEAKRARFSLRVGIPQILGYMLAAQTSESVRFGMVTNGESFIFLKLLTGATPCYGKSPIFLLDQDAGLERSLQIMKAIGAVVGN